MLMAKKSKSTEKETETRSVPLQLRIKPSDKKELEKLAFMASEPGAMESVAGIAYRIISDYLARRGLK
jgi:hypothetical protein